jgi:hypothetical protein
VWKWELPDATIDDTRPLDEYPAFVRTAVSLNFALFSAISPVEGSSPLPHIVGVVKGDSTVIKIAVGRKGLPP